jgi:hypothetical protein
MHLKSMYLYVLLIFSGQIVFSQQIEYKELRGDEVFNYHYDYQKTHSGYIIHIARLNGTDTTDKQVLVTDNKFNTKSWNYIRFGEETNIMATLTAQGEVMIKGVLDGDKVDELEELDVDEPWIQLFPLSPGFENFIFSDEDELVFWSIGTESPADMEMNSFSAEKEEQGYSDDFGCEVIRVNFSPTGWKSMFWDGDYYFRPSDARVMGYRGDGAPGKSSAKTTLIREE